jgi:hypothetical protein
MINSKRLVETVHCTGDGCGVAVEPKSLYPYFDIAANEA